MSLPSATAGVAHSTWSWQSPNDRLVVSSPVFANIDHPLLDARRISALPLREVFAVEQHDGVGGRPARRRAR